MLNRAFCRNSIKYGRKWLYHIPYILSKCTQSLPSLLIMSLHPSISLNYGLSISQVKIIWMPRKIDKESLCFWKRLQGQSKLCPFSLNYVWLLCVLRSSYFWKWDFGWIGTPILYQQNFFTFTSVDIIFIILLLLLLSLFQHN